MVDTELMFEPDDDVDLDPSRETRVSNDKLQAVRSGVAAINLAMAAVLVPAFAVVLLTAVRSDAPERWTTFWISTAVLLGIALVVEMVFVARLLRSTRDAPGVFTGDERA